MSFWKLLTLLAVGLVGLLLLLLLLAVLGAALLLVKWLSSAMIDGGHQDDIDRESSDPRPEPWDKPFVRTGDADLEYSIRLKGTVYRWHHPEFLFLGDDFHRTFEDGPWKWDAQGRFAGSGLLCGHYFGLSEEAATEEATHYR